MADQTFHTPSFGDEDFDIPAMHSHPHQHSYQTQMMTSAANVQQSNDGLNLDPGGYQQPIYLQQQEQHTMQPISTYNNSPNTYNVLNSSNNMFQHMQYIQHPQQQMQQQMQYRSSNGESPPAMQNSIPENNNTTTSEDSDDSTPLSAMMTGVKRPSPEPADTQNKTQKKPKAQKKKKKRDPNEPQKPVSAYALFFRDTQAAIKGQNPNASFGEVSKIVASMWDALDTEHKDVYKKKTEAAKKEYLKALAAYRASLVSKGSENDQHQQQQQIQYGAYSGGYAATGPANNVAYQVYSPQAQPSSPQQHQQMNIKKSPHLTQIHNNTQQQQSGMMSNSMAPPPTHMTQQHMQQMPQQQYMHQVQQQVQVQQPTMLQTSPTRVDTLANSSSVNNSQATMGIQRVQGNSCIRHGCTNPAVSNCEWEDEYCSNECVVSHCRDVFTNWVTANANSQQNYSTVK